MQKRATNVKTNFKDPNVSSFLGIGEGRVAAANAAADVARQNAADQTKLIQALIDAQGGYNAEKAANEAAAAKTAADTTKGKYTVYIAIGVVLVLMVGLYFIVKKRKG